MKSIAPGVALFPSILSAQQQENLTKIVMNYGEDPNYGFKKENGELIVVEAEEEYRKFRKTRLKSRKRRKRT